MPTFIKQSITGDAWDLTSPTALPDASGFLWNKCMMLDMNCRGFATAQFMQPEPAKYCYGPSLEAKTFMQPEQRYFDHSPSRCFYIRDNESREIISLPFAPIKKQPDKFCFTVRKDEITWKINALDCLFTLSLHLSVNDPVEIWSLSVTNQSKQNKQLSIITYFPFGYLSWMNQGARYDDKTNSIIASYVTPYQKLNDYFVNKSFKEKSFLCADRPADSFETVQAIFEGNGGLSKPDALKLSQLQGNNAAYETPVAAMQFDEVIAPLKSRKLRLLFGAAKDDNQVAHFQREYFSKPHADSLADYKKYISSYAHTLISESPDTYLDCWINHWLPRQLYYHGATNRLTTDPQTRNYLQDNMGMAYLDAAKTRIAIINVLQQQKANGDLPDGILLHEAAELKYINQITHADHCIWLPLCIEAYLNETNDKAFLQHTITRQCDEKSLLVAEAIEAALSFLLDQRDERGLCFIHQGDWCDPMNMVGYKGKGVSLWLTIAAIYTCRVWDNICSNYKFHENTINFSSVIIELENAVEQYAWNGQWYSRAITDAGRTFGTPNDTEGKMFLNPQSWAMLSGISNSFRKKQLLQCIDDYLLTPYGPQLVAPPFTGMQEDIGRVTQKFPGSAENGSVYCHAVAFYIAGLYQIGASDKAYATLLLLFPQLDDNDLKQRGQLPIFIPNYYRGAWREHPRTAGKSSRLFNTGTVAWLYRTIIEELFGLKGTPNGLAINPQLPSHWTSATATRLIRGATFRVTYSVNSTVKQLTIDAPGLTVANQTVSEFKDGAMYTIKVTIPKDSSNNE